MPVPYGRARYRPVIILLDPVEHEVFTRARARDFFHYIVYRIVIAVAGNDDRHLDRLQHRLHQRDSVLWGAVSLFGVRPFKPHADEIRAVFFHARLRHFCGITERVTPEAPQHRWKLFAHAVEHLHGDERPVRHRSLPVMERHAVLSADRIADSARAAFLLRGAKLHRVHRNFRFFPSHIERGDRRYSFARLRTFRTNGFAFSRRGRGHRHFRGFRRLPAKEALSQHVDNLRDYLARKRLLYLLTHRIHNFRFQALHLRTRDRIVILFYRGRRGIIRRRFARGLPLFPRFGRGIFRLRIT